MAAPTHLAHKPIVSVDDYASQDGIFKDKTDAVCLSVGRAQYDWDEISAKVFRQVNRRWSRVSEELPLHRVFDLGTVVLKSILMSAHVPAPATKLEVGVANPERLGTICDYYKNPINRSELLPKLRELKMMLDYFLMEEPKL